MYDIKIHFVNSPSFTVNGKLYRMETKSITCFESIDYLITNYLKRAKKKGLNIELAIYNITNMYFSDTVKTHPDAEESRKTLGFIAHKFFISDNNHLPVPLHKDGVFYYHDGIQVDETTYKAKLINKRLSNI